MESQVTPPFITNAFPLSFIVKFTITTIKYAHFSSGCFEENISAPGNNANTDVVNTFHYTHVVKNVLNAADCQVKHCQPFEECKYFTYNTKRETCYLKNERAIGSLVREENYIFGPKYCEGTLHL